MGDEVVAPVTKEVKITLVGFKKSKNLGPDEWNKYFLLDFLDLL